MNTVAPPTHGEVEPARYDAPESDAAMPSARARRRQEHQTGRLEEAAIAAVCAVAAHLDSGEGLPAFFSRLGGSIAGLSDARRAAFWRLGPRGTLTAQPVPFGFPHDSPIYDVRLELGSGDASVLQRLIFEDASELRKGTTPALDALWRAAGLTDATNSIAAPWRAGDRRLGAVAVYDSPHGFTHRDLWLLRLAANAAGLLWQYRQSEDELGHTAVRLEEAMAARRHLLNNIAAGGDEARRRFASALHDDECVTHLPSGLVADSVLTTGLARESD